MSQRLTTTSGHHQKSTTLGRPITLYESDTAGSGPDNRKKRKTCAECNKEFKTTYTLNRHVNTAHQRRSRFTCRFPGCGRSFERKDVYDRHIENQHGAAKVVCDRCGKLIREDGLRDHQTTQTCQDMHAGATPRFNIWRHRPTPSSSPPVVIRSSLPATPQTPAFESNHAQIEAYGPPTPFSLFNSPNIRRNAYNNVANVDFDVTNKTQSSPRSPIQGIRPTFGPDSIPSSPLVSDNWPDQTLADYGMVLGELDSEMSNLRDIARRASRIHSDVPEDIDELWRSDKFMKAVKNDDSLAPFLIQGALRSYKELSLIDFGSQCPLCSEILGRTANDVVKHARKHFKQRESKAYVCNRCGIDFVYLRDLKFHQESSGMCDYNRTSTGSLAQAAATEHESWVEVKFQADRDQYLESLRRWELLQAQWYVSSISKFLRNAERRKGKHATDPARPRKYSNASHDPASKMKHRLPKEGLGLQLKIRSEIRHGSLSNVDIAALFRNFSLKDRLRSARRSTATNDMSPANGVFPSPRFSRTHREDSLVQACAAGDIDQACNDLDYFRHCGAFAIVDTAILTATNAGHYNIVKTFMMDTAGTLRGPHDECIAAWKQTGSRACSYHRNAGHLYKTLLNAVFTLGRSKLYLIFKQPCEGRILELLRIRCKSSDSPLVACATRGELQAIEYLIGIGVPVDWCLNSSGTTALHAASSVGRAVVVDLLINYHASIDRPDAMGQTALIHAVDGRHFEVVKLLLSRGATTSHVHNLSEYVCPQLLGDSTIEISIGHDDQHETLLIRQFRNANASTALVTVLLLEADIDIGAVDRVGRTALHWACILGRIDIARRLLEVNACIDTRDDSGATPLLLVIRESIHPSQSTMLSFLLRKGADVNAGDTSSWTPLIWAVYRGKLIEAEILLRGRADMNAITDENDEIEEETPNFPLLVRCRRYSPLSMASLIAEPEMQQKMVSLLTKWRSDANLASRLLRE